jgi:hypothetical protein
VKDKTVGRIDHSEHDHPTTARARKECRAQMLAEAKVGVAVHKGRPKDTPTPTPPPLALDLTTLRGLVESLEGAEQELCGYASLIGAAVRLKVDETPVLATFDGVEWSLSIG